MAKEAKEIKLSFSQLLATYEQYKSMLEATDAQRKIVEQLLFEVDAAKQALKEIKKASKGQKLLVPLGSGVYAYAALQDTKAVKMEIASNIYRRMPIASSLERLEERESNLRKSLKELEKKRQNIITNLAKIEQILASAQKRAREAKSTGVA